MPKAASKASIPASLEPMEARLVSELPTGPGWQFEPKIYRLGRRPWTCFARLAFGVESTISHVHNALSEIHHFPTQTSMVLDQLARVPEDGRLPEIWLIPFGCHLPGAEDNDVHSLLPKNESEYGSAVPVVHNLVAFVVHRRLACWLAKYPH